jgi:predicted MFS family arabinose efflux permease
MDLESPASIRFTSQAFYSTFVLNAGMIIGSIAGGAIAQRWGYSAIFLFSGGLSLIGTLMFVLFVRPPKAHESHGQPVQA